MARLGRRVRITGNPSLATFREELPTNRELGLIQGFIWWSCRRGRVRPMRLPRGSAVFPTSLRAILHP